MCTFITFSSELRSGPCLAISAHGLTYVVDRAERVRDNPSSEPNLSSFRATVIMSDEITISIDLGTTFTGK